MAPQIRAESPCASPSHSGYHGHWRPAAGFEREKPRNDAEGMSVLAHFSRIRSSSFERVALTQEDHLTKLLAYGIHDMQEGAALEAL